MTSKLPFTLVAPPPKWVTDGVQGICIGQCVVAAQHGEFGRGRGFSWEGQAHAHSQLFLDPEHNLPDFNFGWICVQSPQSKKHGADITMLLGEVILLPDTSVPTLINPGVLAYHEYAHILCSTDPILGEATSEGRGHGPLWRATISELGFPQEAQRYLQRIHTRKGPAAMHGFKAGQIVRVKDEDSILPKYQRGQRALVTHVAKLYVTLEFLDVRTNNTLWPYWLLESFLSDQLG